MKRIMFVTAILLIISIHLNVYAQVRREGSIELGEKVTIRSKILNEDRQILIYLPDGYENSSQRYSVLYMLGDMKHFIPSVGISKYLSDSFITPELVIIAIPTVIARRDYTPTSSVSSPVGGGADKFLRFINEELFPFVEKNYRIQPYRIFSGQIFSGLCVFYALLATPEMFNAYIAFQSVIYGDDKFMVKKARNIFRQSKRFQKLFYFSVEDREGAYKSAHQEMAQIFEDNPREGFKWKFEILKAEIPGSKWAKSFSEGLEFVSPWNLPEDVLAGGLETILEHYKNLNMDITETMIYKFAKDFQRKQDYEKSNEILKYGLKINPGSCYFLHELGDNYVSDNQLELALETYKKGIKVAEENSDQELKHLFYEHIVLTQEMIKKK